MKTILESDFDLRQYAGWWRVILLRVAVSLLLARTAVAQTAYRQVNLVSDVPGVASLTDSNLVNPWGIAFSASGPFWISDNHTG